MGTRSFFYSLTILLIIAWVIAYLGFRYTGVVHILLVIALVSAIFALIQKR